MSCSSKEKREALHLTTWLELQDCRRLVDPGGSGVDDVQRESRCMSSPMTQSGVATSNGLLGEWPIARMDRRSVRPAGRTLSAWSHQLLVSTWSRAMGQAASQDDTSTSGSP